MLEFEEIEVDASGTYFSSNDFGTPGGTYVMLGFGTAPQPVNNPELFSDVRLPSPVPPASTRSDYRPAGRARRRGLRRRLRRASQPQRQRRRPVRPGAALLRSEAVGNRIRLLLPELPLPPAADVGHRGDQQRDAASGRYFVEYPEDIQMYGM